MKYLQAGAGVRASEGVGLSRLGRTPGRGVARRREREGDARV